jgi:hypothetical protein
VRLELSEVPELKPWTPGHRSALIRTRSKPLQAAQHAADNTAVSTRNNKTREKGSWSQNPTPQGHERALIETRSEPLQAETQQTIQQ